MASTELPTSNDASTPKVDETPLSPVERRNSLEKHLQQRPDQQDLKNRGILLDTNAAPALQSAQFELERQRATDSLKKGLEKRPEREELVERNILMEGSAAPAIQKSQKDLERSMRRDSLEKHLQSRPAPGELVKEGILEANENPLSD